MNSCCGVIRIQAWWRGVFYRRSNLPLMLRKIKKYLTGNKELLFCGDMEDGRSNSFIDEHTVIRLLQKRYGSKIRMPPRPRHWFDMSVLDAERGWIPIDIKSSAIRKHRNRDNGSGWASCMYALTDMSMDLEKDYKGHEPMTQFYHKLEHREYNSSSRDYYYLILNKMDFHDVIINSLRGMQSFSANSSNPPFQVCWNNNRDYVYRPIGESVRMFLEVIGKTTESPAQVFIRRVHELASR